jgi:hypothetical protein
MDPAAVLRHMRWFMKPKQELLRWFTLVHTGCIPMEPSGLPLFFLHKLSSGSGGEKLDSVQNQVIHLVKGEIVFFPKIVFFRPGTNESLHFVTLVFQEPSRIPLSVIFVCKLRVV